MSGQGQSKQQGIAKIADLRWSWVEEFFRSRELAWNTRKAYEHELKRFLLWTEKTWHGITHRDIDRWKRNIFTLQAVNYATTPSAEKIGSCH
jgi:uncharacterized protein with ParB-like and HNH nuclease domain